MARRDEIIGNRINNSMDVISVFKDLSEKLNGKSLEVIITMRPKKFNPVSGCSLKRKKTLKRIVSSEEGIKDLVTMLNGIWASRIVDVKITELERVFS